MTLHPTLDHLINIPTNSVDLITTSGDLTLILSEVNRVVKPEGAIVVYGSTKYIQDQRKANQDHYRYSLGNGVTMLLSNDKVPASAVFREIGAAPNPTWTYNPQTIMWSLEDYIVRTYTNPGDTVLDPYATPETVDAVRDRNFIGIQEDPLIFEVLEWMMMALK